jgi:hypothetical protein
VWGQSHHKKKKNKRAKKDGEKQRNKRGVLTSKRGFSLIS